MKLSASVILASALSVTTLSAGAVDLAKVPCSVPISEFRDALLQATN